MKHFASPKFWRLYRQLPAEVRALADKNFQLLKADPKHPSLRFKKIDKLWSVRVGAHYRALGLDKPGALCGFGSARMPIMTDCCYRTRCITTACKPTPGLCFFHRCALKFRLSAARAASVCKRGVGGFRDNSFSQK